MKKLYQYIEKERILGCNILIEYYSNEGPGSADYIRNCAIINSRFVRNKILDVNEDFLIGVLFHEIGHLKYFKNHPIEINQFNTDSEFKNESEYYAFYYSLLRLKEIAEKGDVEPLRILISNLNERIKKIENNDFSNEGPNHTIALQRLSKDDFYLKCVRFCLNL